MPRIGCVDLPTRQALLTSCLRPPFRSLPKLIGSSADAFIGFPFLSEPDVPKLKPRVPPETLLAALIPGQNFDPIEDHRGEPDFGWTRILLDDFGDINDDLGTLAGATESHFQTQLSWRPRVDPKRTAKVAIIAPGPWHRTTVREPSAIPVVSCAITESGYDAIAIRCKSGDDEEFASVVSYAEQIARETGLPLLLVSKVPRDIEGTRFAIMVREALTRPDLEYRPSSAAPN